MLLLPELGEATQDNRVGVGDIGKGPESGAGLSRDVLGDEIGFVHRLSVSFQRGKGESRCDQGSAEIDP